MILINYKNSTKKKIKEKQQQQIQREQTEQDEYSYLTLDESNQESSSTNQDVQIPFLPEKDFSSQKEYTLVIDLDETLIYYNDELNKVLIRPYGQQFLEKMSNYFEIIIFTAAQQSYAEAILEVLNKNNVISHYLFRQHTTQNKENELNKDLDLLGRDIKKCIIIDNIAKNYEKQFENGILIQTWMGESCDRALYELYPLLREIVTKKYDDVRVALRILKEQMNQKIINGVINPQQKLFLPNPI